MKQLDTTILSSYSKKCNEFGKGGGATFFASSSVAAVKNGQHLEPRVAG
jgi:hypothetical protein